MNENLETSLTKAGVFEYGAVDPNDVEFTDEVRSYCVGNVCRQYGTTWACPPAVGTVDECRERAQRYDTMLVFSGKYDLEDSQDFEGMMNALVAFKSIVNAVHDEIRPHLKNYILLGNEGCGKCKVCTYPDKPCRFPEDLHASLEGYGVYVTKIAKQTGIKYNNGAGTITYFGALLYNDADYI